MANVNRETLNHTHTHTKTGVDQKTEPDLLVKTDFSAPLFTEGLSSEGKNSEEKGRKEEEVRQVAALDTMERESNE